jgi:hypothetical protein
MARRDIDEQAILSLATGATFAAVAVQCGCSDRTVRRRWADPAFRARVDEQRAHLVSNAVGRLASFGTLAGDTLGELLQSPSDGVRLRAAGQVLAYLFRGMELDALAREVAELKLLVANRDSSESTRRGGTAPA